MHSLTNSKPSCCRRAVLWILAATAACVPASPPQSAPASAPPPAATHVTPTSTVVLQAHRLDRARAQSTTLTPADLDRRTAELFGDALRGDVTLTVPDEMGDAEPTWDIDVRSYETVDRVRHYVEAFSGAAKDRFVERLSRGTRYESLIRSKMRAGDIPEDMYYLALVESGYNPHAYSRAAAVGMWQFMTTTARGMGLRVDWWIDERRDPVRSTEAAVRFLHGLREQFGSIYLAAAAYNGGPGRVARGLTRYASDLEGATGDDMFFALAEKKYLRNETKDYVPQLVAAALVAKEPARYGLEIESRRPFTYDSVRVGPRVPLAVVAEAAGASIAELQELNPHILRGMTPPIPARDSTQVRIPVGTRARFDSAFALLGGEALGGARTITTGKAATWASLAAKEKVSARTLPLYNPKVKPAKKTGRIAAGTQILIPTPATVAAALPVPDPGIERYGAGTRTHIVRRGENLSVIAKRYRTSPAAIMRLNRLKKPLIFPGQELLVRGSGSPRRTSSKAKPQTKKS